MLSGKRQHWVGLSKKNRKDFESFPFKDFAILVLIAVIVTMIWTWYGAQAPKGPLWVEHQQGLQNLAAMRALRQERQDLTDDAAEFRRERIEESRTQVLEGQQASDAPMLSHDEGMKKLIDMRRRITP